MYKSEFVDSVGAIHLGSFHRIGYIGQIGLGTVIAQSRLNMPRLFCNFRLFLW